MLSAVFQLLNNPSSFPNNQFDDQESELFRQLGMQSAQAWDYQKIKELLSNYAGVHHDQPDVSLALENLDKHLGLGFGAESESLHDDFQYRLKLIRGLFAVPRFDGDILVNPESADNTGIHTLHTLLLANQIFARADMLSGDTPTRIQALRLAVMIGILDHDTGEAVGEISSVSSRSAASEAAEGAGEAAGSIKNNLELIIAKHAHQLAATACRLEAQGNFVCAGEIAECITLIRREALKAKANHGEQALNEVLMGHLETFEKQLARSTPLSAERLELIDLEISLMKLIDSPEIFFEEEGSTLDERDKTYLLFYRALVKAVESLQGNRFYKSQWQVPQEDRVYLFSEPAEREPLLAYSAPKVIDPDLIEPQYMEAKQLSDSMRFSEKHLGVLLHYASILREQYGCEEEEKLAHEMMRSMYETYVEMLAHAPEYTDLNNTKSDPAIRQAVKLYRLHELTKKDMLQAADVYRQQRQEEVEALRDVSRPGVYSREQLTEAYKAAAQGAYRPQLNTEHPMSRGICLIDDREALERLAKS
jgi:hypothetical protein